MRYPAWPDHRHNRYECARSSATGITQMSASAHRRVRASVSRAGTGRGRPVRVVRAVERPAEYTALMVVARQGADVRRHPARPVLGRAWDARGGGVVGHSGR